MRAKERIEPFIKYIMDMWKRHPDERFGQMLKNIGISTNWHIDECEQNIPHESMREIQHWGTRGLGGNSPVKQVPICKLELSHLKNILDTQTHISKSLKDLIIAEIEWRETNED